MEQDTQKSGNLVLGDIQSTNGHENYEVEISAGDGARAGEIGVVIQWDPSLQSLLKELVTISGWYWKGGYGWSSQCKGPVVDSRL